MRVKSLGLVMLVSALVGCATPKPELPAEWYERISRSWIQVHNCNNAGELSPEDTAWILRYMTSELQRYSYDPVKLNTIIQNTNPASVKLVPEECKDMAVLVADRKIQTQINNQNAARTEQQIQDAINSRPTNTYCNKIGAQVLCNSY